MEHVKAVNPDDLTDDKVHYEGCGLIGSHTLCGYTDTGSWEQTKKRVNCDACIAVRDHVLGKRK